MANCTPLRYPGGKARLRPYVAALIVQNGLSDGHYAEPFCGGAAVALELLMSYVVSHIHLNDLDPVVYAFWHSVVHETDAFCDLVESTPCTMDTWHEQRAINRAGKLKDKLALGFSTFFMNRTNRSGILAAGVIGGKNQDGPYKLNARYNKDDLIRRIRAVGRMRSRISVYRHEATTFLTKLQPKLPEKSLIYLDPPYVEKGPGLYLNAFDENDHRALATYVRQELQVPWMVSYDAHPLVRECYGRREHAEMNLSYSAFGNARGGQELVYFSKGLKPPDMTGPRRQESLPPWHKVVKAA